MSSCLFFNAACQHFRLSHIYHKWTRPRHTRCVSYHVTHAQDVLLWGTQQEEGAAIQVHLEKWGQKVCATWHHGVNDRCDVRFLWFPCSERWQLSSRQAFFAYLGAAVSRCEDDTDMVSQKWGGKRTVNSRYKVTFSSIWSCVSDFLANDKNPILTVFWAQLSVSTSCSPTVLVVFFKAFLLINPTNSDAGVLESALRKNPALSQRLNFFFSFYYKYIKIVLPCKSVFSCQLQAKKMLREHWR